MQQLPYNRHVQEIVTAYHCLRKLDIQLCLNLFHAMITTLSPITFITCQNSDNDIFIIPYTKLLPLLHLITTLNVTIDLACTRSI